MPETTSRTSVASTKPERWPRGRSIRGHLRQRRLASSIRCGSRTSSPVRTCAQAADRRARFPDAGLLRRTAQQPHRQWVVTVKLDAYDAAGNLIKPPSSPTFEFDAENRVKSVNSGTVALYTYDADGSRVKKVTSAGTWYTFRDLDGNPVYEYKTGAGGGFLTYNHYFQGRLVFTNSALLSPTKQWIYSDHLGSPWLRLDAAATERSRHRYYPFGEEFQPPANPVKYRYNAKERDSETGLHDYGARSYDTLTGRFNSADPLGASGRITDPQTWNRYPYVRNNPVSSLDPNGLDYVHLTGRQKELIDEWAVRQNEESGETKTAQERYDALSESQRTTYEAVTHAMMNTKFTDSNGNVIGTALDMVERIDRIAGGAKDGGAPQGAGGDRQFRLYVTLAGEEGAPVSKSSVFSRSTNIWYHQGYPISFRQQGGVPSVQFSMAKTFRIADIDVDYRKGIRHHSPKNSDVRAGDNYEKHVRRYGTDLVPWWRKK